MTDLDTLKEQAARLDACCAPMPQAKGPFAWALMCQAGADHLVEELIRTLASGAPATCIDHIERIAAQIADAEIAPRDQLPALLYWVAVDGWLASPAVEEVVARIDQHLERPDADTEDWDATAAGDRAREAVAALVAPVAGVDVVAASEYAAIYIANFPPFSLPLGDVDRRAAAWVAQILDLGDTRRRLREVMTGMASAWADRYPRASRRIMAWATLPIPADPAQDSLWVQALTPLARDQT